MTLILVGQILAAHGIKGEVKVKSFTEDPLNLCEYGALRNEDGSTKYQLKIVGVYKGALIAKIKGITDRNAAEALAKTKTKLYVTREQLPDAGDGQHYVEDLKGFAAVTASGKQVATLKDIQNYGAGDIGVFVHEDGKEFMLPFKEPYVGKLNTKKRTVIIMIPPGWLSDEKPPAGEEKKKPAKRNAKVAT